MNLQPSRALPGSRVWATFRQPILPVCLLALGTLALAGCGAGGASSSASSGSPVIVGTANNSLPAPPAQTRVNTYAGIGVTSQASWNWYISQPNQNYYYSQQQGVSSSYVTLPSAGIFSSVGDFEYMADDLVNVPYALEGLNAEIPSGVSLLEPVVDGFTSTTDLVVGLSLSTAGCVAPNGTVNFDYLRIASTTGSERSKTDSLFASAGLTYKNGVFHYSNSQQFAVGGAAATTKIIPFADSYCVQAFAGYGLESVGVGVPGGDANSLVYLGNNGILVGAISAPEQGGGGLVGIAEPSAPIDLAAVTAGSYKGYYYPIAQNTYPDPAYFGTKSAWVASATLAQTGSSLVGGFVDFNTWEYTYPPAPVTGNIRLNFGTQDSSHPGLFPSAAITEPSTASCPVADQSTGSDGNPYCTFPVAALIGETYGKFVIFVSGPDLTTGSPAFYALVQD